MPPRVTKTIEPVYLCVAGAARPVGGLISFHSLDLRLARLLLITHDRAGFGSFHRTHKLLAQMLGVRRVGVTNAAGLLPKQRLLNYTRGEITILNRISLEKASCNCYQASKDVYERVLA